MCVIPTFLLPTFLPIPIRTYLHSDHIRTRCFMKSQKAYQTRAAASGMILSYKRDDRGSFRPFYRLLIVVFERAWVPFLSHPSQRFISAPSVNLLFQARQMFSTIVFPFPAFSLSLSLPAFLPAEDPGDGPSRLTMRV